MNITFTVLSCIPVLFFTLQTLNSHAVPKFAAVFLCTLFFFIIHRRFYFNKHVLLLLSLLVVDYQACGPGWEPFENILLMIFCLYLSFIPKVNRTVYLKLIILVFSVVIPYQVIAYSLSKTTISVFTGNSAISSVLLALSVIMLYQSRPGKHSLVFLLCALPALFLLQSRSVMAALLMALILMKRARILRAMIIILILIQFLLLAAIFLYPDPVLEFSKYNYRFYIWRCMNQKDFLKIGVNLFKKDSYRLQHEITRENVNYLYYTNQIDNLHNDFFQLVYDYSVFGFLIYLLVFYRVLKHDSMLPSAFFLQFVCMFHHLIYSPAFLFYFAPIAIFWYQRKPLKIRRHAFLLFAVFLACLGSYLLAFAQADYMNRKGLETLDPGMLEQAMKKFPLYYFPYAILPQLDISKSELIDAAIRLRKDPNFYYIKGKQSEKLYFDTGKENCLKDAIQAYQDSIRSDPLNIRTRILLYDLYQLTGMTSEASQEEFLIRNLKLPSSLETQSAIQKKFREANR